jgi:uncharacterized membrane protein
MYPYHFSLLVHFIGVGCLFAALLGGFVITMQYRKAADYPTKLIHLRSLKYVGLFSPAGVVILVLSGIGNMVLQEHRYTLFSDAWLSVKLVLVAISFLSGAYFAGQSIRRAKLIGRALASGTEVDTTAVRALDSRLMISYGVQSILLLAVLALSVVRPVG